MEPKSKAGITDGIMGEVKLCNLSNKRFNVSICDLINGSAHFKFLNKSLKYSFQLSYIKCQLYVNIQKKITAFSSVNIGM